MWREGSSALWVILCCAHVLKTAESSLNALFFFPNFWKSDVWDVLLPSRLQWHVSTTGVAKSTSFFHVLFCFSCTEKSLTNGEMNTSRQENDHVKTSARRLVSGGRPRTSDAQCEHKQRSITSSAQCRKIRLLVNSSCSWRRDVGFSPCFWIFSLWSAVMCHSCEPLLRPLVSSQELQSISRVSCSVELKCFAALVSSSHKSMSHLEWNEGLCHVVCVCDSGDWRLLLLETAGRLIENCLVVNSTPTTVGCTPAVKFCF